MIRPKDSRFKICSLAQKETSKWETSIWMRALAARESFNSKKALFMNNRKEDFSKPVNKRKADLKYR